MIKASILLISWNHETYIAQCLESCLRQTHPNLEIILLDNCSTDRTVDIAVGILENSGISYKIIQNKIPQSICNNLNTLLRQAIGKYMAVLSTDDWFQEENIAQKVALCEQDPTIGGVFSTMNIYFEDTRKTETTNADKFKRGHIYKEIFNEPECINNIGNFYRREAVEKLGGWDENLLIEDMDMNTRIAREWKLDYIDKPLLFYRRKNSSISVNVEFMIKGFEQYYEKYKNDPEIDIKAYLAKKYREFAALSIDQGNYKEAYRLLSLSTKAGGLSKLNVRSLFYLVRKASLSVFGKK